MSLHGWISKATAYNVFNWSTIMRFFSFTSPSDQLFDLIMLILYPFLSSVVNTRYSQKKCHSVQKCSCECSFERPESKRFGKTQRCWHIEMKFSNVDNLVCRSLQSIFWLFRPIITTQSILSPSCEGNRNRLINNKRQSLIWFDQGRQRFFKMNSSRKVFHGKFHCGEWRHCILFQTTQEKWLFSLRRSFGLQKSNLKIHQETSMNTNDEHYFPLQIWLRERGKWFVLNKKSCLQKVLI